MLPDDAILLRLQYCLCVLLLRRAAILFRCAILVRIRLLLGWSVNVCDGLELDYALHRDDVHRGALHARSLLDIDLLFF
jgi:hypothetical protein